ncbi:MAG: hypothetical protein APF77_02105 [Clostridia bacterium BRH_c25]|nr:MAG: hypothetical protein APF77_02105 [Clostridia bacterium BRH_c25]
MTQPPNNDVKQDNPKKTAVESNTKTNSKQGKKKERKDRKGNTLLLIVIILILASIVTFGAIFMFNFAGLRSETSMWITKIPVIGKLMKPVIENKSPEQLAREEIELAKSQNAIELEEINEKKKELEIREKKIESIEKELAEKELQINETLQKLSGKLTSVQEQVQYLEKVDSAKAMQIILSMDDKASAVQILRNMKKEKASAILALMDPLQAAQIIEDLSMQEPIKEASEETANP